MRTEKCPAPSRAPACPTCPALSSRTVTRAEANACSSIAWIRSARVPVIAARLRRQPETLGDDERERHSEHAEKLEVDPSLFIEIVEHDQVRRAHQHEESDPHPVEPAPVGRAELEIGRGGTHHALDQRTVADSLPKARKESRCKEPVDDGRLPHDEGGAVYEERETPENQHESRRHEMKWIHAASA